jgi:hypothetical protein
MKPKTYSTSAPELAAKPDAGRRVPEERNRSPTEALWALGVVAGLFSLVVCAFMIVNNLRLKTSDPIHTPALQRLVQELKASPQNEALKEQIREMDYLASRVLHQPALQSGRDLAALGRTRGDHRAFKTLSVSPTSAVS